jgi:hypothetical protein
MPVLYDVTQTVPVAIATGSDPEGALVDAAWPGMVFSVVTIT